MSPFFRDSYCLYPFWNSSRSKNCVLVVKKPHGLVVYSVTHRMRPSPQKKPKLVSLNLAGSREGCDARCDVPKGVKRVDFVESGVWTK